MTVEERFWSKVDKRGPDNCWVWTAYTDNRGSGGYGQFKLAGKTTWAHQVAFLLSGGRIGPDDVVMHSCNNPSCVNPAHLSSGRQGDNIRYASRLGRMHQPRGRLGKRLTDDQVRDVRAIRGRSCADIASEYGVSRESITQIRSGRRRAGVK